MYKYLTENELLYIGYMYFDNCILLNLLLWNWSIVCEYLEYGQSP